MITRLPLIDATDFGWCKTAATDARHIFYNRDFIAKLRDGEVDFLFGHELLHCVLDHLDRRKDRIPLLWNVANDYVVNDILVEEQVGKLITTVKACYDRKYHDMASEEIYDDLYENAEKVSMDDLLDQHLDMNGGESTDEETSGQSKAKKTQEGDDDTPGANGPPKYSEEEKKKIKDEFKNAMIQSAQAAGAGNVPEGVKRLINELTNPTIDWRELIDIQIQSTVKDDYTFMKQSRRSWHSDAILPGMNYADSIDIAVGLDASGSISDDMLRDMLSEVKGCMTQYDDFTITVFAFDTEVYGHKVFNPWNIDEIDTYEIKGGGGTEFEVCWDFMKENDINPKKFIMFTDGYPWSSWGDEDYCDTIFVIHSYHDKNFEAPFGLTAHYEPFKEQLRKAA
jgi:predicted metal-dependent peptidase